jgi:hypothetical protein
MCVTDDHHVTYRELWQAFAVPVDSSRELRFLAASHQLLDVNSSGNIQLHPEESAL